ncbi:hypothetical protein OCK74_12830 [Chitinophagaceae bacterium LB-8]|uniref:Uncharacterized protein n=1 Tax=Paraflavisolibacter caeni TaxID=2982496 RepID=A0A9X2XVC7_9BACT|nr:hypothetical protein [Paraflavisolibacter caeni]MCU7550009.1 hypothetical protein [Paraflavisolibacter caeni]
MKTKAKDRHDGRSIKNNEEERSPDRDQSVSNEPASRRKTGADKDVGTAPAKGYFPDGPGGSYKGV